MMYSLNDRNHGVLRNETKNHQNGHDSLVKQVLIINCVKECIGVGVEEYGRNKGGTDYKPNQTVNLVYLLLLYLILNICTTGIRLEIFNK